MQQYPNTICKTCLNSTYTENYINTHIIQEEKTYNKCKKFYIIKNPTSTSKKLIEHLYLNLE